MIACIGLTNVGNIRAIQAKLKQITVALNFRCDRSVDESVDDLALILLPYGRILDLFRVSIDRGC